MADIVDPVTRSVMMSRIRCKNTKPELTLRSLLHRQGFRFRLHGRELPGRPDIVFPRHKAVVFVHGCFWHGHTCRYFRWPASRPEFWRAKIGRNQFNDAATLDALQQMGWRVAVVWECALRGKSVQDVNDLGAAVGAWLASSDAVSLVLPVELS